MRLRLAEILVHYLGTHLSHLKPEIASLRPSAGLRVDSIRKRKGFIGCPSPHISAEPHAFVLNVVKDGGQAACIRRNAIAIAIPTSVTLLCSHRDREGAENDQGPSSSS